MNAASLHVLLQSIASDVHVIAQATKYAASPLLTRTQLAALLQVDIRSLRRLELEGEIPRAIHVGKSKRWRRSDIEKRLGSKRK